MRNYNSAKPVAKIACGANAADYHWTRKVLETTFDHGWGFMNGLSLHYYTQHVHHLSDICHLHTITVLVKQIQVDTCHQRIPHGILLIQEAGVGAGLHIIP